MVKGVEFDIYDVGFAKEYAYTSKKVNCKQRNIQHETNNKPMESSCIISWNSLKNWEICEKFLEKEQSGS